MMENKRRCGVFVLGLTESSVKRDQKTPSELFKLLHAVRRERRRTDAESSEIKAIFVSCAERDTFCTGAFKKSRRSRRGGVATTRPSAQDLLSHFMGALIICFPSRTHFIIQHPSTEISSGIRCVAEIQNLLIFYFSSSGE